MFLRNHLGQPTGLLYRLLFLSLFLLFIAGFTSVVFALKLALDTWPSQSPWKAVLFMAGFAGFVGGAQVGQGWYRMARLSVRIAASRWRVLATIFAFMSVVAGYIAAVGWLSLEAPGLANIVAVVVAPLVGFVCQATIRPLALCGDRLYAPRPPRAT